MKISEAADLIGVTPQALNQKINRRIQDSTLPIDIFYSLHPKRIDVQKGCRYGIFSENTISDLPQIEDVVSPTIRSDSIMIKQTKTPTGLGKIHIRKRKSKTKKGVKTYTYYEK